MEATQQKTRRPGAFRRLIAKVGVVGLIATGAVLATAAAAGADAANVATTTATAVVNGDGSITVTVQGTWTWASHNTNCGSDRYGVGWAVDWADPNAAGNPLAMLNTQQISVGVLTSSSLNAADNAVHYLADPPRCGTFTQGVSPFNTGTWGPISHTYEAGTDFSEVTPCAVVYDGHPGMGNDQSPNLPGLKKNDDVATGSDPMDYNHDNSVQENGNLNVCSTIEVPHDPDVSITKTGPDSVTVGNNFDYTLTAANTGIVPADDVVISDTLPTNVAFVSATDPCSFDTGTRVLTCDEGTLDVNGSVAETVTVTALGPAGTDIVNTATVTPDDATPGDNTSTWTIPGAQVLAAEVVVTPVTPAAVAPAAVQAAPAFTG